MAEKARLNSAGRRRHVTSLLGPRKATIASTITIPPDAYKKQNSGCEYLMSCSLELARTHKTTSTNRINTDVIPTNAATA